MFTEFDLTDGPVSLHVTAGPANGPPLVMWHGVGRRGIDFLPLVPAPATRWHLHLIDHRGHGASARVPGVTWQSITSRMLTVLSWLGRPAVLFGHSLGAVVVAGAAAMRSESVRAAILEDPPTASSLSRLEESSYYPTFMAMRRLAGAGRSVSEVARELGDTIVPSRSGPVKLSTLRDAISLRFLARCLADVDGEVFTPALEKRWMDGYDERAIWRRITCPTLLLRGDPAFGGVLPQDDADRMMIDMADLTQIDFPGVGHLIHGTATELTTRHVVSFLESL